MFNAVEAFIYSYIPFYFDRFHSFFELIINFLEVIKLIILWFMICKP